MSSKNETIKKFQKRLISLLTNDIEGEQINDLLNINGKITKKKLESIKKYISDIKDNIDINIFNDTNNYKQIKYKNDDRFYFRHDDIRKLSFTYQLNPNPCKSFYFTSNSTKTSIDYYGYTDYDVDRLSNIVGIRCVPIDNIEENITDEFKKIWSKNTKRPLSDIFEFLIYVYESGWFEELKKDNNKITFRVSDKLIKNF
jgi:hypothetical protein